MVARTGGYYRATFCRERGVNQVNPLSPTIFNVVVDAVVSHWESLLVEEQEGGDSSGYKGDGAKTAGSTIWDQDGGRRQAEEGHQQLTVMAALLYTNDGIVASIDLGWIQSAFDTLKGIFDRVVLHTNIHKTVGMMCRS